MAWFPVHDTNGRLERNLIRYVRDDESSVLRSRALEIVGGSSDVRCQIIVPKAEPTRGTACSNFEHD